MILFDFMAADVTVVFWVACGVGEINIVSAKVKKMLINDYNKSVWRIDAYLRVISNFIRIGSMCLGHIYKILIKGKKATLFESP